MKRVELYGWLGKKYGKVFDLAVRDPAHAIRLLCANFPGFRQDVGTEDEYAIIVGKRRGLTPEQLREPLPEGSTIKIVPMPKGSKSGGIFQTIIGIVLIVVGVVITVMSGGSASPVGASLIAMGIGMVIGGVAQMLMGTPKTPKAQSNDAPENRASDLFNGAVNTSAQGNPVPVCLGGPIRVGAYVVGAGYSTVQL